MKYLSLLLKLPSMLGISKDLFIVLGILSIIFIIVVPLPSVILDIFLLLSLSTAILILFISVYVKNPASLTMFPTLILVITLFRLSINVATTRSILSEGHNGPESVSRVVSAFGDFVVGGNYAIGVILFIILVLINFMVVTKGSTRVAEVAARFTLDSLPGKQMAIDADLNAGFIDDKQAQILRNELIREANFYGAMDGSSKFVKGDAVAGIIITFINIIGGFLIGVFQFNLDMAQSASTYTLLTIGDGLVAQLPALIISTATGILITRSTKDTSSFATGVVQQLGQEYKSFTILAATLFVLTFLPGFPGITLFVMSMVFLSIGIIIYKSSGLTNAPLFNFILKTIDENKLLTNFLNELKPEPETKSETTKTQEQIAKEKLINNPPQEDELLNLNILELRFGYQLASIVGNNSKILERLKGIKKSIAEDIGFIIPSIRVIDDSNLMPNEYSFYLKGDQILKSSVEINKLLAIPKHDALPLSYGIETVEPTYGMTAYWIDQQYKEDAMVENYMVVDLPNVIATHVKDVVTKYAHEIISRQDIVFLYNSVKTNNPRLIEDLTPAISIGQVLNVFRNLLKEGIPTSNILTILETIADTVEFSKNPKDIINAVRMKLFRVITNRFTVGDTLHIVSITPEDEQILHSVLASTNGVDELLLNSQQYHQLVLSVENSKKRLLERNIAKFVIVVDEKLRSPFHDILDKFSLEVNVLSHAEIDSKINIKVEENIKIFHTT